MAVSEQYLNKVRFAVRRSSGNKEVDEEITDQIEECRQDMVRLGIKPEKTQDQDDRLILGAVRSFVRWRFGLSNEDAEANKNNYRLQVDELRRSLDYVVE